MARKRKHERDRVRRGMEPIKETVRDTLSPVKHVPRQTRSRPLPKQEARGTFKVAAATRQARQELPQGVLYEPKPRKPREPVKKNKPPVQAKKTVDVKEPLRCKSRPKHQKKGKGAGRSFVPWCG